HRRSRPARNSQSTVARLPTADGVARRIAEAARAARTHAAACGACLRRLVARNCDPKRGLITKSRSARRYTKQPCTPHTSCPSCHLRAFEEPLRDGTLAFSE